MQARHAIRAFARLALFMTTIAAFAFRADAALVYSNRYRSPRNPERRVRRATTLIVLHTTEGAAHGSLVKVCERGECHYCVTEDGTVYNIVDLKREAFHAGRSMWCGREDCDEYSVGIEVVGYHDKPVTQAQITALRELVAFLKGTYNLSDDKVICHSHVAYGAPNKWQPRRHRGRKRCGMLFAMPSVRTKLGLRTKPGWDPDVRAGRLIQADSELAQVLYGRRDTMVGRIGLTRDGGSSGGIVSWFTTNREKPAPATVQPRTWKPTVPPPPKPKAASKLKSTVSKAVVKPKAAARPKAGEKLKAAAKPGSNAKPKTNAKPVSGSGTNGKSKTETKTAAKTKTDSRTAPKMQAKQKTSANVGKREIKKKP